jgi:hypothetical protein
VERGGGEHAKGVAFHDAQPIGTDYGAVNLTATSRLASLDWRATQRNVNAAGFRA